jgi:hypothetical protein
MRSRVFEAAAQLFRLGVPLGFKTCLVKENKQEIKEIERFAQSHKADYRLTTSLAARLDGNTEPLQYAYAPHVKRKGKAGRGCLLCTESGMAGCASGKTQAAITPAGELKLCVIMHQPLYPLPENDGHTQWERLRQYRLWLQK